jgi:hypothetical protein
MTIRVICKLVSEGLTSHLNEVDLVNNLSISCCIEDISLE